MTDNYINHMVEGKMKKNKMIKIATWAIKKNLDYSGLYFCKYMKGRGEYIGKVYKYVTECQQIGQSAFKEKYKDVPDLYI